MNKDITIQKLLDEGYNFNSIDQIIKGRKYGFPMEKIENYISGDQIRILTNYLIKNITIYNYDTVDILIDILNKKGDIKNILDRANDTNVFRTIRDRINKEKSYEILFDIKHASQTKINLLLTIQDEKYNISKEDIKKIKETPYTIHNRMLIDAYNQGLDNVFQYIDQKTTQDCIYLANIEKKLGKNVKDFIFKKATPTLKAINEKMEENFDKFKKAYKYIEKNQYNITDVLKIYDIIDEIKEENIEKFIHIKNTILQDKILESQKNNKNVEDHIDFIVGHNILYNISTISQLLDSITKEKKEEFNKQINKIEEKENIKLEPYDILYALELFCDNIDIQPFFYDINNNYINCDRYDRHYYQTLLYYNNTHPSNAIDPKNFNYIVSNFYQNDFDYLIVDNDFNINQLLYLSENQLSLIREALDNNINKNTLRKIIDKKIIYKIEEEENENILNVIANIIDSGYSIRDEIEENKNIIAKMKQIDQIKNYNEFTKNIIGNKLDEKNLTILLKIFKDYIEHPQKQNIYHYLLTNNIYKKINITDKEKIKQIEKQIKNNPNKQIQYYCDEKFSIEQIKFYNKLNIKIDMNKNKDLYKIYNPKFNIDQLKAIEDTIKNDQFESIYINPKYSPKEIKLYSEWNKNTYIYNPLFKYCQFDENKNKKITQEYKKILMNNDFSLPLEEQNKIKITNEIKMLKKIEKEDGDLDFKLAINKVISNFETELNDITQTNTKEIIDINEI